MSKNNSENNSTYSLNPTPISKLFQDFSSNANIKSKMTRIKSPRQNGIHEKAVGLLRAELLNHVIPFNQRHLEYLLKIYLKDYYHPVRTHQELNCLSFTDRIAKQKEMPDNNNVPPAFKQTEFASSYESRIGQTPADTNLTVGFEGIRGESLCMLKPPPDTEIKQILDESGIDGIEYRNAVPDFLPTAKAQVEIDYMLGGNDSKLGSKARDENFAQADIKLAKQLNKSPKLAHNFGMKSGGIKSIDIKNYRKKNKLTWHEVNNCKTIQLVPSKINSTFGHLGGIGEINAGAFKTGGFACKA